MSSIARNITLFTEREIKQLFAYAKPVLRSSAIEIRIAPSMHEYGHILIIASRKVGSAPVRNQLKRWIKAVFYQQRWYEKKQDAIIILRAPARKFTYIDIQQLLANVFAHENAQ